jgi:predicted membrane protein
VKLNDMTDFETRGEERRRRWEERVERQMERRARRWSDGRKDDGNGRIWTGVFLLIVGGAALLKSFLVPVPDWLFTWQTLLIAIGVFIGLRHSFHGGAWFILILIGGAFLLNDYFLKGDLNKHIWPVVIIAMGAFFILRPGRKSMRKEWEQKIKSGEWGDGANKESGFTPKEPDFDKQDFIDATSIFGSTKKNILSKNFIGGDITNIFGGTELNLTQADINGKAVIDITTIFGGAELFVPSHWMVKSEVVTIFGGVEDKRSVSTIADTPDKVLILKGTVIFGGIEIKNFKK